MYTAFEEGCDPQEKRDKRNRENKI